jgi:hypothetical protein
VFVQHRSLDAGLDPLAQDAPILDPWEARAREAPKTKTRAGVGALIAAVCLGQAALVGLGAWLIVRHVDTARVEATKEAQAPKPVRDEVEPRKDDFDRGADTHAPYNQPPVNVPPTGSVPQETERHDVGNVQVVELGVKVPSLRQALSAEIATAKAAGKDVLVMTTRAGCDPCSGVAKAIADGSMQRALSPVVVVKVDVEVFDKELDTLQMQRDAIPGFFLLGADASPRDAIDGGEWEADIPENIAPVLGPFVRGQFTKRKNEWKKPMPHGVFL